MVNLNADYWNNKYKKKDQGWDIGYISPPLKEYIDQLQNKNLKILIPGCGNAYEAEYLYNAGFKNVYVIDFSQIALDNLKKRIPSISNDHLICDDFFKHIGKYDLIIEQTFFCAITPNLRSKYAKHMFELLNKNGKLVGLLFNDKLNDDKPPFGGNKDEYLKYFSPYFDINIMDIAYNSISPRMDKELFINLSKK